MTNTVKIDDKTVFLLGAGFSNAVSARMPLVRCLAYRLLKTLPESFPEEHRPDPKRKGFDFEKWLSELADHFASRKDKELTPFELTIVELSRILLSSMSDSFRESHWTEENDSNVWLHSLFEIWDKLQSPVLTFNYDTLIEHRYIAFKDRLNWRDHIPSQSFYPIPLSEMPMPDKAALQLHAEIPRFELFKLHGSLNWWRKFPHGAKQNEIYFWDRPLRSGPEERAATGLEPLKARSLPFLVPPLSKKTLFYEMPILEKTREFAAKKLESASSLIVMGYSFPKTDHAACEFLSQNLHTDAKVHVIDKSECVQKRAIEIFGEKRVTMHQFPENESNTPIQHFIQSL